MLQLFSQFFIYLLKKILFIYLAAPGLSCGMWDLVPWPGIEPKPPDWERGILTTGPPGKSLVYLLILFVPVVSEQDLILCSQVSVKILCKEKKEDKVLFSSDLPGSLSRAFILFLTPVVILWSPLSAKGRWQGLGLWPGMVQRSKGKSKTLSLAPDGEHRWHLKWRAVLKVR